MTSSAASDTLSARKTGHTSPIVPLMTATPPPEGMCTSSSTTSGALERIPATASTTDPASPTISISDSPASSARTPDRNTP
ncbi:Uncharacterised protein [Mycobacteroides abscessus subsp. abscessus]|nr:Uncharacterised protein [Mycobacteroides abscessus subsp. abscessus]